MDTPTQLLSKFGKKGGGVLRKRGSEYFSELGKKSAKSPIRTKEYYSELGKRSAAKRKKKKQYDSSPLTHISKILSGKFAS